MFDAGLWMFYSESHDYAMKIGSKYTSSAVVYIELKDIALIKSPEGAKILSSYVIHRSGRSDSDREDFTMANVTLWNKSASCNSFHMPRTYGFVSNKFTARALCGL